MRTLPPILETERLVLKAHGLDDLESVVALWSNADVARFIGGRPSTREECWARLLRYAGSWSLLGFGFWTIRDRAAGTYFGEAGLLQGQRALHPGFGETPEVGWALMPSAQGKGLAREALHAVLNWAQAQGIEKTVCMIELGNIPSIKLAERLGFAEYARTTYHGTNVKLYERVSLD